LYERNKSVQISTVRAIRRAPDLHGVAGRQGAVLRILLRRRVKRGQERDETGCKE
jgi:hypothetical protein